MKSQLNGITLTIQLGDLLTTVSDAVVVSALPDLSLHTELGQQLLAAAGEQLAAECRAIGFCEMGQAALTSGGNLPTSYIIHAVGPVMGSGNERGKLSSAVWSALKLAESCKLTSLAFSPLSIGQFGYPVEGCAAVMAQKIVDFTFEDLDHLKTIAVLLPNEHIYSIFEPAFQKEIETALEETSPNIKSSS